MGKDIFIGSASHRGERVTGQRTNAALRKQDVAVPLGIGHAALIREQWRKPAGSIINVSELLGDPPRILATAPVVVVAAADPIHIAGVANIPPLVKQRAIVAAVHGNLAVTVELAANNVEAAIRPTAKIADGLDASRVGRVDGGRLRPGFGP